MKKKSENCVLIIDAFNVENYPMFNLCRKRKKIERAQEKQQYQVSHF